MQFTVKDIILGCDFVMPILKSSDFGTVLTVRCRKERPSDLLRISVISISTT